MSSQLRMCLKCFKKLTCITSSKRFLTSGNHDHMSKEVRRTFLEFFCQQNGHRYVKPSSVIPGRDQGTYFTNAGMNQFKPIFLGTVPTGSEMASYRRVANSQKCVRVGGKHNDLADVGVDKTHHTFFEMLGSWSFGDYFKTEACSMALELLQKVYKLPPDRLYFTYFGGDKSLGLEPDLECREIWRQLGVPEKQILPFSSKDNFWDMGDTGPCGPCTEIQFDHIGNRDAASLVNTGDPGVVEIWNLVFMQYDRQRDGALVPLPCTHVDTGMGLERICAVLQGTTSNYNTDLFLPIFNVIQKEAGAAPYTDTTGCHDNSRLDTAYRIVADHTRMATMCISDGLLPGRELLEQRLRSVIYRALYQCHQVLRASEGLMTKLVDPVVESLGEAFPEVAANASKVKAVLADTEQRYLQTERDGQKNFHKLIKMNPDIQCLDGEQIKKLHTGHYGDNVSLEMIELVAGTRGISVDEDAMTTIAEENRVFHTAQVEYPWLTEELVQQLKSAELPPTTDSHKYHYRKQGDKYVFDQLTGKVLCLVCGDNSLAPGVSSGGRVGLILDHTQFYAELGGQAGDRGEIHTPTGTVQVTDTQTRDGYVLHIGTVIQGHVLAGQEVAMAIDAAHREGCMRNHTCTHVLGAALRQVLGPDTCQQGSAVGPAKFTYDFSCVGKVGAGQLREVERLVGEVIQAKLPVERQLTDLQEALASPEVVYLQNVIYPSEVFVVSLATSAAETSLQSAELCGGTHLLNTADIGQFCITNLSGLGSGTKSITCLTGEYAGQVIQSGGELEERYEALAAAVKAGTSVDHCVTLQKHVLKMLGELTLPKVVKDTVARKMEELGTSINTLIGKQALARLKQDFEEKMQGTKSYVVHTTSAKTLQKVLKQMKSVRPSKPCILVVKTTNSTSAMILLPQDLLDSRAEIVDMFLEISGGHVSMTKDRFVIVSGRKNTTELFEEAANRSLSRYTEKRTKTSAS